MFVLGTSGANIGSTNSLQHQPSVVIKAKPSDRGSVGSLNDLPTAQIENLPPIRLVKEINYADESSTLPSFYKKNKSDKVKASDLKHFKKGVQLTDRLAEDVSPQDDEAVSGVEHNLIYQGVGFRHPHAKKPDAEIRNESSEITDLEDPNYSTIPHFSKLEAKSKASGKLNDKAVTSASSKGQDFDEAGYSTVPEARAAVQSLFSTDTDFVNISNFSSIPEATVSLDDDPGYETLDETKKKVNILKRESGETKPQDKKLVLIHKVRKTESTAVQTDDIYDNCLISPLREPSATAYDNVTQTPLASPQSCVSGYNSLGNSPSSPPTTSVVTGASVISSQDSGIDGAGPVFTPPRLVKITSPQSDPQKTKKTLHVATLVTVTGEANQQTFVLDEETSQTPKPGIKKNNTTCQDTNIKSPTPEKVDDDVYSSIGDRTERPVDSTDKNMEHVDECNPNDMDSDEVAPPLPSRNYLLDDEKPEKPSIVRSSLQFEIGALSLSQINNATGSEQMNSGAIKSQDNSHKKDEPSDSQKFPKPEDSKSDKKDTLTDAPKEKVAMFPTEPKINGECSRKHAETVEHDKDESTDRQEVLKDQTCSQGQGDQESEDDRNTESSNRQSGQDQSVNTKSDRPVSGTSGSGSGSSNPNSPGNFSA